MKRENKNTLYLLKRFLPYFKKHKLILVIDLFCAMLTTLCDIILPLMIRRITDLGLYNLSALTLKVILSIGVSYLVLRIIDILANYFMQNIGHVMGAKIETDMRMDLFAHLQKLSYSYYSNTKIGQLMSRITSDLFDVTEFAHHCPEEFFIAGIKIIASFIILCTSNVWLTLIVFVTIPLMIICSTRFNRYIRNAYADSRKQLGEINACVEDSLLGIRVVKSFANEDIENAKFEKGNEKFLDTKKNIYKYMAAFGSSTRFFDGLMYIVVVVVGALFLKYEQIGAPEFVAYLLYVSTLLTSIRRIVEFTEQFQRGITGIERFVEVMDEPIEIPDDENATEMPKIKGEITFKNVSFSYSNDESEVLRNINLKIKPGENIALVGPSGAGKTTLCNLIPRFYDVCSGNILIDDVDIKNVKIKSLREQIGIVQQDIYLFSGTVYENIEYGKPGATREEVYRAAELAGAHEFILELINGYDTFVGERGVKLSGGQKQRISIARVFLKNPPILILDEATSALDNESEHIVQNSLSELAKGRTTITIAHRLTTIRNADKIIVLTDDGIKEQGCHDELMKLNGLYHNLYSMYNA